MTTPLSAETIAIVKSTAPVLMEHGNAITTRLYEILFERYPQTRALFANAATDQSVKLATAVAAYAANIDHLEALTAAVDKIVNAHVRSGVQPEHYPMVADAIISAMGDVLGAAATPEIVSAWQEAYQLLADLLIAAESRCYADQQA
ncbi:globin domain-containing protein [Oceanobacter mangrovi]|uniref:globin domain-containing protein n=1 Tax=Oceanobacter mangrovi TaxID=2862510 RepID=UPI001C8D8344|nr:globin domain-containing protein [Oceanobacter mangrovi]